MGRFFLGFAVGALIGALIVLLTARRDEGGERMGLRAAEGSDVRTRLTGALVAGQAAARAREQEMMADFRSRLKTRQ